MFFGCGLAIPFPAARCRSRRYAQTPPSPALQRAARQRQSPWVPHEFPLHSDSPGHTQSANSGPFPSPRLVQAWHEGLSLVPGKRPRFPKWRRAFASPATQTVRENPASAVTAQLQLPSPLTLRRAGTSAARTPPLRAAGWDVASFLPLFCALTMENRCASQVASRCSSSTLPGSLNVSQSPASLLLRSRLYQRGSLCSLRLSLRP